MIVVATTEKDTDTDTEAEKPEATSGTAEADDTGAEAEDTEAEDTKTTAVDEDDDLDPDGDEADEGDKPLKGKRDKAKRRKRTWGQYLRRSAMPLLLAASLAVSGFLGWRQWQEHQINQAGEQARQAAIAYAGVLTSIDSNKIDQNFRQVLDGATGEFKDMYTQSSVQLRQLLIDNKATAHGVVVDSAIASESMNEVVVLLFIDQTVTNMQVPDPRIDRSRIKMTMEKVDGRWRASKVQLL
jgi:Mce-associated membrane protein